MTPFPRKPWLILLGMAAAWSAAAAQASEKCEIAIQPRADKDAVIILGPGISIDGLDFTKFPTVFMDDLVNSDISIAFSGDCRSVVIRGKGKFKPEDRP